MPTYRFDLNEEYGRRLEEAAEQHMMSVQDYIRFKLFPSDNIFTVQEVVKRVQESSSLEEFTIPDLYTQEEWSTIERSIAGVLGKNFFKFISSHSELGISLVPSKTIKRRAVYKYERRTSHD